MKILFLDDSDARWYSFKSKIPAADRVETAEACVAYIRKNPELDWVFLDHDLGGEAWVNSSREDCGMEVVRFLCADDYTKTIKNIVVHSHNSVASEEMFNKLKDKGYNTKLIPFFNLISAIDYIPNEKVMADEDTGDL
jgi:hypothetical protein